MFPTKNSSDTYFNHVSAHEIPMLRAGIGFEERSKITAMKLAQDGDLVKFYFRCALNNEKLLGIDYGKAADGPKKAAQDATTSFERRFPNYIGKYLVCHD